MIEEFVSLNNIPESLKEIPILHDRCVTIDL